MGRILCISFIVACLTGCKDSVDISGSWIEIDNFKNPTLLYVTPNRFAQIPDIYGDTLKYQIAGDRIVFSNDYERKFTLVEGQLNLLDNDSDSIIGSFQKMQEDWFIDHLMASLNISVNLPDAAGLKIPGYWNSSIFFMYKDSSYEVNLSVNGEPTLIDSLLYLSLLRNKEMQSDLHMDRILLVIDEKLKMKHVRFVEHELRKAQMKSIINITGYNTGSRSLYGLPRKLRALYKNEIDKLPDSLQRIIMPPPPPPDILRKHTFTCELLNDSLFVQGKYSDLKSYQQLLKERIVEDPKFVLTVNIDEQSSYGSYINFRYHTQETYDDLRNEYTLQTHGVKYKGSAKKIAKEAKKKYPMMISEVST